MDLVLATRNPDKVRELRDLFSRDSRRDILLLSLSDFPDLSPIEETGRTLEENAILKAQKVSQETKKITLSDDTGLEVEVLGGKPGVLSSRYARPGASYEENRQKLLLSLQGIPEEKRGAIFRCVAALATPEGWVKTFEGTFKGRIGFEPKGQGGFGYDPLFIVEGTDKTFAEMSLEEKNRLSHRAMAMRKVIDYLRKLEMS